jgi:hypothetical protein
LYNTRDVTLEGSEEVFERVKKIAAAATGKTSIGHKGMLVASKTLAASVLDLLLQPDLLSSVRAEWKRKTQGKPYKSPLPPDATPPVVSEKKNCPRVWALRLR